MTKLVQVRYLDKWHPFWRILWKARQRMLHGI